MKKSTKHMGAALTKTSAVKMPTVADTDADGYKKGGMVKKGKKK